MNTEFTEEIQFVEVQSWQLIKPVEIFHLYSSITIAQVLYTPELYNPVLGTKLTDLIKIVGATFIMEKGRA